MPQNTSVRSELSVYSLQTSTDAHGQTHVKTERPVHERNAGARPEATVVFLLAFCTSTGGCDDDARVAQSIVEPTDGFKTGIEYVRALVETRSQCVSGMYVRSNRYITAWNHSRSSLSREALAHTLGDSNLVPRI